MPKEGCAKALAEDAGRRIEYVKVLANVVKATKSLVQKRKANLMIGMPELP